MADRFVNYDKLLEERHRLGLDEMSMIHKVNAFNQFIDHLPTADVVEVKHGEWIHTDKAKHWTGKDECSECTYHTWDRDDLSHLNYCPNCGAKMDGGKAK